jgi:hypothetical protein
MLCHGYSEGKAGDDSGIGRFGNGVKTSSVRMGRVGTFHVVRRRRTRRTRRRRRERRWERERECRVECSDMICIGCLCDIAVKTHSIYDTQYVLHVITNLTPPGSDATTLRVGRDCLVTTRCARSETASAALYSQSFLRSTRQQEIMIPIVTWRLSDGAPMGSPEERKEGLAIIMRWSPFKTEKELLAHVMSAGTAGGTSDGTAGGTAGGASGSGGGGTAGGKAVAGAPGGVRTADLRGARDRGSGTTVLMYNLWRLEGEGHKGPEGLGDMVGL